MITCNELFSYFKDRGSTFFTGVSDSCFGPMVNYLLEHEDEYRHIIATNEGEALAIAAGYHLSTGEIPVVYLQNDGLLNMMNPLTSLVDDYVYALPALLLISWRGAPDRKDASQHKRIGEITPHLLALLDIPYYVYGGDNDKLRKAIDKGLAIAKEGNKRFAILFFKGDIEPYPCAHEVVAELSREEAIKTIIENAADEKALFVSTTGKTSRELFEYKQDRNGGYGNTFFNVGAMGYANSIGFGLTLNTNRKVFVLDGDGALLMHMGNMATIGHYKPRNLYHILLNNFSHDSTGGQPTVARGVNFCKIAEAVGYTYAAEVKTRAELIAELKHFDTIHGPAFLTVYVRKGARDNLGRPTVPLAELKALFMKNLNHEISQD